MINNYVISLIDENVRREHILNQFNLHQTRFYFYDAITPNDANGTLKKLNLHNKNISSLSAGELACALSHISLWHLAVERKLEYIAIFEDDVYLGKDFNYLMNNTGWLSNIHILKLEKFGRKVEMSLTSKKIINTNRKLYQLTGHNLGTAGYILSLTGAKYLIKYIEDLSELRVIDEILFDQRIFKKSIPIYQMSPALVIQDTVLNHENAILYSALESNRKIDQQTKRKLSKLFKVKRELIRLIKFFKIKKVEFY